MPYKPATLLCIRYFIASSWAISCLASCISDAGLDAPGGSFSTDGQSGPTGQQSSLSGREVAALLRVPEDLFSPPGDAVITDSGLASRILVEGKGQRFPAAFDSVRVHYTGWQTNGVQFASSVATGRPSEFALNSVIPGWTEGLQLMVEGEMRRFWIPEELAYQGRSAPFGMLVYDVELIQILGG